MTKIYSAQQCVKLSFYVFIFYALLANTVFAEIIFQDNFESSTTGKAPASKTWGVCSGNCAVVTTEKSRKGNKALKSYLSRSKSKVKYRTEAVPRGQVRTAAKQGEHFWYGFSVLVPNNHIPDNRSQDIVVQWHHSPDTHLGETNAMVKSPPMMLVVKNNTFTFKNSHNPNRVGRREDPQRKDRDWNLGSSNAGKWTDWVIHVKWSWKNDGILEVWKDGNKVISHKGPNNFNDAKAPWPKIGLYKSDWRKPEHAGKTYDANIYDRVFYHDEIKFAKGASAKYDDVAPGNGSAGNTGGNSTELLPPTSLKIITK